MDSLLKLDVRHIPQVLTSPNAAPREGPRNFVYLDISLGSLSELSYTLMLARDLKILAQGEWLQLDELHRKAGGMTWLLYKSLLARKVPTAHS